MINNKYVLIVNMMEEIPRERSLMDRSVDWHKQLVPKIEGATEAQTVVTLLIDT